MSTVYYDQLLACIVERVTELRPSLIAGELTLRNLLAQMLEISYTCAARLGGQDPAVAGQCAALYRENLGVVKRLFETPMSYDEYMAAREGVDEHYRELEQGEAAYHRYRRRIEHMRQLHENGEYPPPDQAEPPILREPPGDWKRKAKDFVSAITIHHGTCHGSLEGPPTPQPIWVVGVRRYEEPIQRLEVSWQPVQHPDGCQVTYGVQIQPSALFGPGQIKFVHRGAPHIAFHLQQTSYTLDPVDSLSWMRWRVWAEDDNGRHSAMSDWQQLWFPIGVRPFVPR